MNPSNHTVAIIGLGYAGLPLATRFAEVGFKVLGIESDDGKVRSLRSGRSYIGAVSSQRLAEVIKTGDLTATLDFQALLQAEAILICLPTPLTDSGEPDLSMVLNAASTIGKWLRRGVLVVLESTTYPGTTDTELRQALEEASGLRAGEDFHLAYSPEREDPGRDSYCLQTTPKLVGGYTAGCLNKAVALYQSVVDTVYPVPDCRIAEAAKLLENIFRAVNIALVNELKVVFSRMDLDIGKVIDAAATKPFGFMRFDPGPGLGGHCIPIDPFYLAWKARQAGECAKLIELAGEINTRMPEFVIAQVIEALGRHGKSVGSARILVLGLAYKPDVDDDRESPMYVLMDGLEKLGATVAYNDPYIPKIKRTRKWPHLAGRNSQPICDDYDLVLVVTHHALYCNYDFTAFKCLVVDTRRCLTKPPRHYYTA